MTADALVGPAPFAREIGRWGTAGAFVMTVHALLAVALLGNRPPPAATDAPPAIMIELQAAVPEQAAPSELPPAPSQIAALAPAEPTEEPIDEAAIEPVTQDEAPDEAEPERPDALAAEPVEEVLVESAETPKAEPIEESEAEPAETPAVETDVAAAPPSPTASQPALAEAEPVEPDRATSSDVPARAAPTPDAVPTEAVAATDILAEREPAPVEEAPTEEAVQPAETAEPVTEPRPESVAEPLAEESEESVAVVRLPRPRPDIAPELVAEIKRQVAEARRPAEPAKPRETAPRPPKKPAAPPKREPAPKRATPPPAKSAPQTTSPAAAPRVSERAAAVAGAGASRPSVSPNQWQNAVHRHLERRKRYPREAESRRISGTARVRITIDANGSILRFRLTASSGHAVLDQAVSAMIGRASPLPAPPPNIYKPGLSVEVPIRFAPR